MTLSAIRTRVKNNFQNNTGVTDSQVDQWINDTQRRICRAKDFYWMESEATRNTVDEQAEYSLPTAGDSSWADADSGTVRLFKSELSCHLLTSQNEIVGVKRVYKKDADAKREYRDTDGAGEPRHYAIQRNKLKFYEKPDHQSNDDTAYSIVLDYYGYLGDLSGDSATNILVSNYPEALEYGATSMAWRYLFEEDKAEFWEGKMKDIVEEMILESNNHTMSMIEEGMEPQEGSGMSNRQYRLDVVAHYE